MLFVHFTNSIAAAPFDRIVLKTKIMPPKITQRNQSLKNDNTITAWVRSVRADNSEIIDMLPTNLILKNTFIFQTI